MLNILLMHASILLTCLNLIIVAHFWIKLDRPHNTCNDMDSLIHSLILDVGFVQILTLAVFALDHLTTYMTYFLCLATSVC